MTSEDTIGLHHYRSCAKDCRPVLEDLFSFILKMLTENVSSSCKASRRITQCKIRFSSNDSNAILAYHNNIFHNRAYHREASGNDINGLVGVTFSLNTKADSTEFMRLENQNDGENEHASLLNYILNDMFCIILEVMSGITMFTSRIQFSYREYNIFARPNRPNLFLVCAEKTSEQIQREEAYNVNCRKNFRGIVKPYNSEKSLTSSSRLKSLKSLRARGRLYICKFCNKCFRTPSKIKSHERTHTGERPYKCQYCAKTFSQASIVNRHEKLHTGDRPHKCKYCEKSFSVLRHLKRHESIHSGKKPYKCKYCEKSFYEAFEVKSHERFHTGERPYHCKYCEKTFSFSSDHRSHEKIHIEVRVFKCKYCGKIFDLSSYFESHLRTHGIKI